MSNEKYFRLAELLMKRTSDGAAGWEPTSKDGVFQLNLPDYSVLISLARNKETGELVDVELRIIGPEGREIDRVRDTELGDLSPNPTMFYQAMMTMYNEARRKAMGVDTALDALLRNLQEPTS